MSIYEQYKNSKQYPAVQGDTSATHPTPQIVRSETFKSHQETTKQFQEVVNREMKTLSGKITEMDNEVNKLKALDMDSLTKKHGNLKESINILTTDYNRLKTEIVSIVEDLNVRLQQLEKTLL